MSNDNYVMKLPSWSVQDGLESNKQEYDALAASGDCFVTLATRLDELAQTPELSTTTRQQIEAVTGALLYLQRHYEVTRKPADYRQ